MANFAVEDVQSVLEQFIENVSNLPAELTHLYEELANKDKRVHALKQSVAQKDASIQRFIRQNGSQVPYPKEAAYNKAINDAFKEITTIQDEKSKLARRAMELIDKHIKRLDMKIRDLQREGMIDKTFVTPQMLQQYTPPNFAVSLASSAAGAGIGNGNANGGNGSAGVTMNATPGRLPPALTGTGRNTGGAGGGGMSTASTLEGVSRSLAASAEDQLLHTLKGIVSPGGPDLKRRRLNTGGPAPVNPSPLANASTANSGINTPTRGASAASQGQSASARRSGPPPKLVRRPTATATAVVKKQKTEDDAEEDHSDSDNDDEEEDMGEDQKPYCVCQQVSFGNMVACDNKGCPFEWFHWGCVGLTKEPAGSWFCDHCTKLKQKGVKKE